MLVPGSMPLPVGSASLLCAATRRGGCSTGPQTRKAGRESAELTMPLLPQSEKEAGHGLAPDVSAVRDQLKRLLAHPLFANSKRYPVFLAFTVGQTLLGNASELKERTIGVEAFGREPNYDVNLDPVVRTTAAEVRKRLIQYY